MARRGWLILLVLCALASGPSAGPLFAQSDDLPARVDAYISEQMKALAIPGMAVAIVEGTDVRYLQSYGVADDSGRAITPQTPFLLASVSKSFTGTALMQLVERGQIDLEAPVSDYIPWFREGMNDPAPIRVRDLVYQTSGFSRAQGVETIHDGRIDDAALEDNTRRLSSAPLLFTPGEGWAYSNSNFDVLGYLIEVVSGQPYERYVEENILTPLDMGHTHATLAEARADSATEGYMPFFGSLRAADTLVSRTITPSAGLFASVEDLTRYVIAHLNGGAYGEARILSPESALRIHQPGAEVDSWTGYAMGWFVNPLWERPRLSADGERITYPMIINHDGAWPNFRAYVGLIPEADLGVVALMNVNDFARESVYSQLGLNLALLALGEAPPAIVPYEDAFTQNARTIGVVLVGLLIIFMILSIVIIARRWRAKRPAPVRLLPAVILPALIHLLLALYALVGVPWQYEAPLTTIMRTPDLGIIIGAALVIAIGWGVLRVLLWIALLRRERQVA